MAFSSRLCNPTPFDVKLPWDAGINIKIPAFGSAEISMQQMDDFRPGKPGSAAVKQVLDYHGLFLLDTDRPYDNQALDALRRAHDAKKAQYDSAVRNIIDRRAAEGIAPNEAALEETLRQMGFIELENKVKILKEAVNRFASEVGTQPERMQRHKYDPNRTVLVMDPPREFPSVAAMEFFLDQNPEIKAKHKAFRASAAVDGDPLPTETPSEDVQQFINKVKNETAVTEQV